MIDRRSRTLALVALAAAVLAAPPVAAQGLYQRPADGATGGPPPRLALESHVVRAEVEEHVATYRVEQTFRNRTDGTIEATYLFPLPREAAATGLTLRIAGRDVAGEVLDAETARRTYRDIVRRVKDPALLEYAGERLLRASIFPIGPRAEVKVAFEFTAPARRVGGLSSLVLPLRFAAGSGARVTVDVALSSRRSITTIYSPSHPVDVSRDGARRARVSYEGAPQRPRDLRLYFAAADGDAPTVSLLAHRRDGEDGTFALMIAPPTSASDAPSVPRDVVFVLDRSGSMAGEKWEQATAALSHGLRTLGPADRFSLVSFATDVRRFRDGLRCADAETVRAATSHLEALRPAGGTNVDEAVAAALGAFDGGEGRLRMVAFLTDGLPTVGTTEVPEILRRAGEANATGARVFSFGVGHDVNTVLLDRLARDHAGSTDYIEAGENLEHRVSAFFEKVQAPYLTGTRIDYGGVEVYDVDPPALPDLFRGDSLLVTGRYLGQGMTAIRGTGSRAGEKVEVVSDASWPRTNTDLSFVPSLWASRHVGTLLQEIRLNGARKELVDEVVRLGREFGVVTPYTSGLVVEEGMRLGRAAGLPVAEAPSPGSAPPEPAEWSARRALRDLDAGEGDDEAKAVGAAAFRKAKELRRLRDSAVAGPRQVEARGASLERLEAAGRVVFRIDGALVDRDLTADLVAAARVVETYSDEYFALLDAHP
ncbi:MAG: VIT domain-containing protein, partial [Planctomycetota bacterium JB042]